MPEVKKNVKVKKEKVLSPPTKVVIRHLPGSLTKDEFLQVVTPLADHDWLEFHSAEKNLSGHSLTRAYINFKTVEDIYNFRDQFDGYMFLDGKGNESQAIVEYAPFQKVGRREQSPKRKDPRLGTITDDSDYIEFLKSLENPEPVVVLGTEKMLEQIEARERDLLANPIPKTPLVEFVENRRAEQRQRRVRGDLTRPTAQQIERIRMESHAAKRARRLEKRKLKYPERFAATRVFESKDDTLHEDDEEWEMEELELDLHKGGKQRENKENTRPDRRGNSNYGRRDEHSRVQPTSNKKEYRLTRREREREERQRRLESKASRESHSRNVSTSTPRKQQSSRKQNRDEQYHEEDLDTKRNKTGRDAANTSKREDLAKSSVQSNSRDDECVQESFSEANVSSSEMNAAEKDISKDPEEPKGKKYSILKRRMGDKKNSVLSRQETADAGGPDDIVKCDLEANIKSDVTVELSEMSIESEIPKSDSAIDNKDNSRRVNKEDEINEGTGSEQSSHKSDDSIAVKSDIKVTDYADECDEEMSEISWVNNRTRHSTDQFNEEANTTRKDEKDEFTEDRTETGSNEAKSELMSETAEKQSESDDVAADWKQEIARDDSWAAGSDDKDNLEFENKSSDKEAESSVENSASEVLSKPDEKRRLEKDPRTERKIRNKDRPAMQLYRPGQSRIAGRMKTDSSASKDVGIATGSSGSVESGGGSSSSSTPSPVMPEEDKVSKESNSSAADASSSSKYDRQTKIKTYRRSAKNTTGGSDASDVGAGVNGGSGSKDKELPRNRHEKPAEKYSGDRREFNNKSNNRDSRTTQRNRKEYDDGNDKPSNTKNSKNDRNFNSKTSGKYPPPKSRYDSSSSSVKDTYRARKEYDGSYKSNSRFDRTASSSYSKADATVAEKEEPTVSGNPKPQGAEAIFYNMKRKPVAIVTILLISLVMILLIISLLFSKLLRI